uniref:Integrase catalytic domain-containing protein n=1 Tax=Tanacetum cinerariifolium TaxID=118510 RepID=A0A699I8A9_TANCI|nr:hypothetical protein [Tanacetum cinerariifolium]
MSQDVILCVMNSTAAFGDSVNLEMQSSESYDRQCNSIKNFFQKEKSFNNQNALEIPKYFENNDLKAQLQAKDTIICKLTEHIKSMRGNDKEEKVKHEKDEIKTINIDLEHSDIKNVLDNATTIAPGMFKPDIESISHRLKNNKDAHEDYFKKTIENTDTIHGLVVYARKQNPSEPLLDSACVFTKHVQELLVYVSKTCPSLTKSSEKLVAVTPLNKVKKVRFSEPLTSSSNIHKHVESSKTPDSNTPVLPSTGLKSSTSASRSHPTGIKKNDRILQTPSSSIKNKVVQIVLWYQDSGYSKHMTGNRSQLMNFVSKFLGTVRYRNDQIAKIMGYGDYQLGNVTISRDLDGVDLLSGSKDTNLYTISLDDMLKSSLICLLSKALKTKSWLWHCQLSHLNFSKSKKSSHQPKAEDTNKEKLYLLHMDLCGLMRVKSINEKKYILVIVDDYSRFTWVKILISKDETPNTIIKCIKNIQVCLNATVCNVRTDNGTEFVNQAL